MDGTMLVDISLLAKIVNLIPWYGYVVTLLATVFAFLFLVDRYAIRELNFWQQLKEGNMAVAVFLAALLLGVFYFAATAGAATDAYDKHFRKAWHLQFSTMGDWQWLRAQGMQESRLDPYVCSPAGACGLMQFMPAAAHQWGIDPFHPVDSIYAAARYDHWLWRNWSAPRPHTDRIYLALGSYNWGLGNLLRVQRRLTAEGEPARLWEHLAPHLPRETREYPARIARWCARFTGRACGI